VDGVGKPRASVRRDTGATRNPAPVTMSNQMPQATLRRESARATYRPAAGGEREDSEADPSPDRRTPLPIRRRDAASWRRGNLKSELDCGAAKVAVWVR